MSLPPCPSSPNCVSSLAESKKHSIEPFTYKQEKEKAISALHQLLEEESLATVIEITEERIKAEYKTPVLKFTDDLEFYFGELGTVHLRSASRIGHYDLGKNRKRMEYIRKQFNRKLG
ncbi:DUF1499 domain-containing protein [Salsuginibacillus kocurii]|uniref:DUF1499 domain-containing protein n=1 Tax=Salsuginibacillus kocurii TaxID=427078 RepID=UPI0003719E91|nr:DUF1499 domain-containing protein [Salsuginibacillus kocurii]